MAYHGALTTHESLLHMAETTKAFTTGLLILMKTMMGTTQPTKAMELSMHSRAMEHSGLTPMAMATAITRRERLPIRAKELQELQP